MTPRYLHYPVPVYKGPVVLSSFWQYLWTGLTTTLWMTSEAYRGSLVQCFRGGCCVHLRGEWRRSRSWAWGSHSLHSDDVCLRQVLWLTLSVWSLELSVRSLFHIWEALSSSVALEICSQMKDLMSLHFLTEQSSPSAMWGSRHIPHI